MTSNQSLPTSQRAVVITSFGDPDVMSYQDNVAVPSLKAGQVLVKIAAAGINPVDYKTRQGKGWGADKIQQEKFDQGKAAILGFDLAGEVVASQSNKFNVGDKVAALNFDGGGYSEFAAVDDSLLAKIPETVSLTQAGALPCAGQTAKQFLDFAAIKKGDHVVMNAPAGGVGHILIQLLTQEAQENDLKVTVICSPEKYQKLAGLIDKNHLAGWIDYTKNEEFPELNADMLLDLIGDDAGVRALTALKSGARVFVLPTIWAQKLKKAGENKSLSVEGFAVTPNGDTMAQILQQLADGKIQLHIDKEFVLSEVIAAHKQLEQGDSFGKIVLQVGD